jgi:hypothetical protein
MFFTFLEGKVVLYSKAGVYKQAQLATRAGFLYAATSANSFIRLFAKGATSSPSTRWDWIEDEQDYPPDKMGRLTRKT